MFAAANGVHSGSWLFLRFPRAASNPWPSCGWLAFCRRRQERRHPAASMLASLLAGAPLARRSAPARARPSRNSRPRRAAFRVRLRLSSNRLSRSAGVRDRGVGQPGGRPVARRGRQYRNTDAKDGLAGSAAPPGVPAGGPLRGGPRKHPRRSPWRGSGTPRSTARKRRAYAWEGRCPPPVGVAAAGPWPSHRGGRLRNATCKSRPPWRQRARALPSPPELASCGVEKTTRPRRPPLADPRPLQELAATDPGRSCRIEDPISSSFPSGDPDSLPRSSWVARSRAPS